MSGRQAYTFDEGGNSFYYFLGTVISLYVIPASIKLFIGFLANKGTVPFVEAQKKHFKCLCEGCQLKASKGKGTESTGFKHYGLVIGWILLVLTCGAAIKNTQTDTKIFDPFDILSVSSSASEAQIRKAYKKLSLKFHPDKAKPEMRAEHEKIFVELTRAYRALTDAEARKNWEEYGNPDGPRNFGLGIALPSWLVDSRYNLLVLLVYVLMFGVGLPLIVRKVWNHSKDYTRDNILHTTMQFFYRELKEAMSVKKVVEIMCSADEFKDLALTIPELDELAARLNDFIEDPYEPPKKITNIPSAYTAHVLLYSHFHRLPFSEEDCKLKGALDSVLIKAVRLINGLSQISTARKWTATSMNCMTVNGMLIQGINENGSPLLQLPYLKADILKHCHTKKRHIKSIKDVLEMDEEESTALFKSLSRDELDNLISVARSMPLLLVKSAEFKMLGQESITPGGLVTCLVRLELTTHGDFQSNKKPESPTESVDSEDEPIAFEFDEDGNMSEGGKVRFTSQDEVMARLAAIHAPHFPLDKRPGWWVVLLTRNMTHTISTPLRITDLIDRKTVSVQFAAPPRPGRYQFTLVVRSDCLIGADVQRDIDLVVSPAKSKADGSGTDSDTSSDGL